MDEERFDIYNERGDWIGTAARKEAHAKGLWHRTFHCWIVRQTADGPELLFQRRHPSKDTFPNAYDTSCAGHLLAGEGPEDGVRELEEELGIAVRFEDLYFCGVYPEVDDIEGGVDREFCYMYVLSWDAPLEKYRLQPEEVTALVGVPLPEIKRLIAGETAAVRAEGVELNADGTLAPWTGSLTRSDLTPHRADYYEIVWNALEKLA